MAKIQNRRIFPILLIILVLFVKNMPRHKLGIPRRIKYDDFSRKLGKLAIQIKDECYKN